MQEFLNLDLSRCGFKPLGMTSPKSDLRDFFGGMLFTSSSVGVTSADRHDNLHKYIFTYIYIYIYIWVYHIPGRERKRST